LAARRSKDPAVKRWFLDDSEGTWERKARELLASSAERAAELNLSEAEVDDQIATFLRLQAVEAVLSHRRGD
jgi:hypothetical protein